MNNLIWCYKVQSTLDFFPQITQIQRPPQPRPALGHPNNGWNMIAESSWTFAIDAWMKSWIRFDRWKARCKSAIFRIHRRGLRLRLSQLLLIVAGALGWLERTFEPVPVAWQTRKPEAGVGIARYISARLFRTRILIFLVFSILQDESMLIYGFQFEFKVSTIFLWLDSISNGEKLNTNWNIIPIKTECMF